ncbi:unnamed protein product [Sphagnum jensenii]|uniref:Uncharacterized protein n=1 Tax=Sphagnum jensenii TaxID=128206 RepID=A0ABP1A8J5_9BRYO
MARGGGAAAVAAASAAGGGGGTKSKFQFFGASQLLDQQLMQGMGTMGYRSITIFILVAIASVCSCIYIVQFLLLENGTDLDHSSSSSSSFCTQVHENLQAAATKISAVSTHDHHLPQTTAAAAPASPPTTKSPSNTATDLSRIVFGIGAAAKNWATRKEYIRLWWTSCGEKKLRGFVWLDEEVNGTIERSDEQQQQQGDAEEDSSWPPHKISEDVSDRKRFNWRHDKHKAGVRLSRIVSETFRLGLPEVDWFVIGDDDTFFFPENLVKVLSQYDHTRMFYVGSSSETHIQNLFFSYNMAFGGGGFAISFPLAKALAQMQDQCNLRYGQMLGSDDRIYACTLELGVPLTKNLGFHQMDIQGDPFGILAAHPVTPILSIHHLDSISPIFPHMNRVQSLQKLTEAMKVESGSLMQQSICYDEQLKWSFSVSWGYAVHVHYGFLKPHEMEVAIRTFQTLFKKTDASAFSFKLRSYNSKDHCTHPTRYYMESIQGPLNNSNSNSSQGLLESVYFKGHYERRSKAKCHQSFMEVINSVNRIRVVKESIPEDWYQAPRRSCCKIQSWDKEEIGIHIGTCQEGEYLTGKISLV